MKKTTLGILGLGSRSTLYYLKELNRQYNLKKGGFSTCPFILLNTNFDGINSLFPDTSEQLDTIVQEYIIELEKTDVDHILIPNITLHETIDRLATNREIIHPIHLAITKIKQNNWQKVVLFGSLHSMQASYIQSHFKSYGIEITLPSPEDMLLIDEMRKHIYSETETEKLIKDYYLLIEKYRNHSPVVLACTELSIFKPDNRDNFIDMADIQIAAAIQIAL